MNSDDVPDDSSDRMSPDAIEIEGKEAQQEVDELDNDSDRSPDQIIKDSIAEAPSVFMKFRVVSPEIAAKQAKKKEAAEKRKRALAEKRAEKAKEKDSAPKQKREKVEEASDNEHTNEGNRKTKNRKKESTEDNHVDSDGGLSSDTENALKVIKKHSKGKAAKKDIDSDSDDVEITAYIYVERPVAQPSARTGSSRAPKPKDEDKYAPRGLTMFKASVSYETFLEGVANQLPCAVEDILQEKVTWKFQSPARSTHLSLGGKVGFRSMVGQIRERKPGTRIIILTMPPPRKPLIEKPFWNDDDTKSFDYSDLDIISTHDHVVEQRASFDKLTKPFREALEEKYPVDNNPLFPGKQIWTNRKMGTYFELNELKLNVWASHLARSTATLDLPPIVPHFDHKSRIREDPKAAKIREPLRDVSPHRDPALSAPTIAPAASSISSSSSMTTMMDLLLFNMIQQQQQQLNSARALVPAPVATMSAIPMHVPTAATLAPVSAPQSPAKYQLPDVSLVAFCERYGINALDQERLEKLEFQPGDKIDNLPDDDWKTFAGFTSLSWHRIVEKNQTFIRDARSGAWAA